MNRQRGVVTFALVSTVCAATSYGQVPLTQTSSYVDEQTGITLDAAVARALASEPSLRAVRADVNVGRGLRRQAGLRPNPTMTFERREEPAGMDTQTSVGAVWPLELFRRPARTQTAERALETTRLAAEDRERIVAADVRVQYGATAAASRDLAIADEIVAAAQRQWDLVRARVDAGSAPSLERDLLEVELRRFETERLLAKGRVEAAIALLKPLLGMSADDPLMIGESLEALVGRTSSAVVPVSELSMNARADVREARSRVALADAKVDQARAEGRFDISVLGMYMRMNSSAMPGVGSPGDPVRLPGRSFVVGGAMVAVPLFNRNQGQVAAATADRSGAEARREATELNARAEVVAATARQTEARLAVTLYSNGVLELARQNLDVVRQTFDLGRATVFDVLSEQRRYLEIEQAYTGALRELWDAHVALKRAQGEAK